MPKLIQVAQSAKRWMTIVVALVVAEACLAQASVRSGTLLAGTEFSTEWFIVDSGKPGETVLITGGIHGNEPAGAEAAEQIRHWPIERGKLVVIPRVNRLGLEAETRWIPAMRNDRAQRDLNRNFPREDQLDPRTELAGAVWEFVEAQQPSWAFDLHEGFDFHIENPKSVGSSVISFPVHSGFASALVDRVNKIADSDRPFQLLAGSGPVSGSLTRACGEQLGAASFILETTFKDQPLSLRTRQHRSMVSEALQQIGVLDEDMTDAVGPERAAGKVNVGVFDDSGASEATTFKVLRQSDLMNVSHLGRHDMNRKTLSRFDVLVFPGGSGSKQARALGKSGREQVRKFVADGGGYLGICAGAYLASAHYDWSLDLMNARVFNDMVDIPGKGRKSMWYRGKPTNVRVELLFDAASVIGYIGEQDVRYHNGPIVSPGDDPDAPDYEVLAYFRTENGMYEAQRGTMVDTPAIVGATFGKGRVLAISPHFESTKGLEDVVVHAVEYVSGKVIHEELAPMSP